MDYTPLKIVSTIEARMTSSRLPKKVMLPVAGTPLLEHMIRRVQKVKSIDEIVLATTTNSTDDILVELAKKIGIKYFRGSEPDVMQRVLDAACSVNADVIVELTGDCPLIDPSLIEQTIQVFLNNYCDYASNCHIQSYPSGMETQVFFVEALKRSAGMTKDPIDREHVNTHFHNNPELFHHILLCAPPELFAPHINLTLDEPDDYTLIKKIIEYFEEVKPDYSCKDILDLLEHNPSWLTIISDVKHMQCQEWLEKGANWIQTNRTRKLAK